MAARQVTSLPVIEKTVGPKYDSVTRLGNWDDSRAPIQYIFLHTMVGTAEGANARFNDPKSNVSAHYGILLDGSLWHWVDEDNTAYHCGVYVKNRASIGIEHEDNGQYNDAVRTDALYLTSAKLVADLCKTYGIPCDREHILKHYEAPYPTGCPDGLDVDRIVRDASALLTQHVDTPVVSDPIVGDPKSVRDMLVGKAGNYDGVFTYLQGAYSIPEAQRTTYDNGAFLIDRIKQIQTAYQIRQSLATKPQETAPDAPQSPAPPVPTPEVPTTPPAPVASPSVVPASTVVTNALPLQANPWYEKDLFSFFEHLYNKVFPGV